MVSETSWGEHKESPLSLHHDGSEEGVQCKLHDKLSDRWAARVGLTHTKRDVKRRLPDPHHEHHVTWLCLDGLVLNCPGSVAKVGGQSPTRMRGTAPCDRAYHNERGAKVETEASNSILDLESGCDKSKRICRNPASCRPNSGIFLRIRRWPTVRRNAPRSAKVGEVCESGQEWPRQSRRRETASPAMVGVKASPRCHCETHTFAHLPHQIATFSLGVREGSSKNFLPDAGQGFWPSGTRRERSPKTWTSWPSNLLLGTSWGSHWRPGGRRGSEPGSARSPERGPFEASLRNGRSRLGF